MVAASMFSLDSFGPGVARAYRLSVQNRGVTLDWLASILSEQAKVTHAFARDLLCRCTPAGDERALSEGEGFIFIFDEAAIYLGLDPDAIPLRPAVIH